MSGDLVNDLENGVSDLIGQASDVLKQGANLTSGIAGAAARTGQGVAYSGSAGVNQVAQASQQNPLATKWLLYLGGGFALYLWVKGKLRR